MRKPKEFPEGALERLAMDLKQAKTKKSGSPTKFLTAWMPSKIAWWKR